MFDDRFLFKDLQLVQGCLGRAGFADTAVVPNLLHASKNVLAGRKI